MKKLIFAGTILILALLQATLLYYVHIFNIRPDLLLISAVIGTIYFPPAWGITFSIFAGILKDIFSVAPFGINTFLFFLWSIAIIRLSRMISFENNYVRLALVFIVAVSNSIITMIIFAFMGNLFSWGVFLRIALFGSLYTAIFFPLILNCARRLSVWEERG